MNRQQQHEHAKASIQRIYSKVWIEISGGNRDSAIACLMSVVDEANRTLLEIDAAMREATFEERLEEQQAHAPAEEITETEPAPEPEGA